MRKPPKWIKRPVVFIGLLLVIFSALFWWPAHPGTNKKGKLGAPVIQPIEQFADSLELKKNPDTSEAIIDSKTLNNRAFVNTRDAVYPVTDTFPKNDISKLNPPKVYKTPFSVFKDPLTFYGDVLSNDNQDGAYIENAYFNEDLNFTFCKFSLKPPSDNFIFSNIIVNGNLEMNFNSLGSQLTFDGCDLKQKTSLISRDTVKKNISFVNCEFFKDFMTNSLDTNGMKGSSVHAARLKMNGTLRFYNCVFHNKLSLSTGAYSPNSKILLQHCILPDMLDLSGVTADVVDLRDEDTTNKICHLNLAGSNINKLDIDYLNFELYFPKDVSNDRILSCYEKLLIVLKNDGYDRSYEKLDAEFHHRQAIMGNHTRNEHFFKYLSHISPRFANFSDNLLWLYNTLRLSVILDRLNRVWWNYGYDRLRVIYWSLFIVLMFSWYNSFHYRKLLAIYYVRNLDPKGIHYEPGQWLYHVTRLWYCFLYTSFVFFKINFDFGKMNFASKYMVILLIQYLIGLVCTGFILNLIIAK